MATLPVALSRLPELQIPIMGGAVIWKGFPRGIFGVDKWMNFIVWDEVQFTLAVLEESHSAISEPKSWEHEGWTPPKQPFFLLEKLGVKKKLQLGTDQYFGWSE